MAEAGPLARRGYAWALAAYFALAAAVLTPYWLGGEVLAPDREAVALGLSPPPRADRVENPFFSDFSTVYVPEVAAHLRAPRSGWLATWDGYNEIGRPLYHDAGMSPAYPPTWLLARLTDDPRRLYTWHSLLTLLAGGVFAFLFVRGRGLHPAAAFAAATFLSLTPIVLYWLTFPMFHSVLAWSCGVVYAVDRLARGPGPGGWTLLCFCFYSLLMTAYQQDVVAHAYLFAAFGAAALASSWRRGGHRAALRLFAAATSAVAAGSLLAAPVYLDLAVQAGESARAAVDPGWFLGNLPVLDSPEATRRYVASYFLQDLYGNPVTPRFAYGTGGMSMLPVFLGLFLVGAVARTRATWGWCAWVAIGVLATFHHGLYRFAVEHLGFHLSYSLPVYDVQIPAMIVVAHGVDALCTGDDRRRAWTGVAIGTLAIALVVALAVPLASSVPDPQWRYAALALAAIGGLALAATRHRVAAPMLGGLLAVTVFAHGRPLLLHQRPADIAATSPLVDAVRAALPPGGRFAMVGGPRWLGPNRNATLGLASVHSYNSLSSRRYQTLVERLGGSTRQHGRFNFSIAARPSTPEFALAGIALLVSDRPLRHPALSAVGVVGGAHLYRVRGFRPCCARVDDPGGAEVAVDATAIAAATPVPPGDDRGDRVDLAFPPEAVPTLLVLDRAVHPHWRAIATAGPDRGRTLEVVAVNGAFLGVRVPPGTAGVRVRFEPWVRHAGWAHGVFLLLFAALAVGALRRRLRAAPTDPAASHR